MANRKSQLILAMLLLFSVGATAAESLLWQGSKKFSGWSDVVNIEGSRFNGAEADDVLHLSITASSGAQLQLSWGSGWTCFDDWNIRTSMVTSICCLQRKMSVG